MILRARHVCLEFPRPALIMGIVNVTPDSFSDGGQYLDPVRAIEHALALEHEGAEVLDIGGESTRPGAEPVSVAEELRRVIPVIEGVRARSKVLVSIDTQKTEVARQAIAAGAEIINDIGANCPASRNRGMWELAAGTGAAYVLMHMKGTPQTMNRAAEYDDVVGEVDEFFMEGLPALLNTGMAAEQVLLDPGIGFAKTAEQNFQLLAGLRRFTMHQRPVLLGASRKSFIGKLLGAAVDERLPGSIACAAWAVLNGVQIIRAHDAGATLQAVRLIEEIKARASSD